MIVEVVKVLSGESNFLEDYHSTQPVENSPSKGAGCHPPTRVTTPLHPLTTPLISVAKRTIQQYLYDNFAPEKVKNYHNY